VPAPDRRSQHRLPARGPRHALGRGPAQGGGDARAGAALGARQAAAVTALGRPAAAGGAGPRAGLRPKLLLLDEPLSALDKSLRADMQRELKDLHRRTGVTFLHVTHDQEEALAMSDRIVVLNNGAIEQVGRPRDLYRRPRSAFVASFLGDNNLVDGRVGAMGADGLAVECLGVERRLSCPA